jgi:hypothetical protein
LRNARFFVVFASQNPFQEKKVQKSRFSSHRKHPGTEIQRKDNKDAANKQAHTENRPTLPLHTLLNERQCEDTKNHIDTQTARGKLTTLPNI